MHSNLLLRTLSSLVLAPAVLAAIWFSKSINEDYSIPLYQIFLAILGTGLAWEWEYMFTKRTTPIALITALIATLTVFMSDTNPLFSLWLILVGTTLVFWKTKHLGFSLGVLYICLPLLSLSYIYYVNENISRELVLWLLFVVWATDIGGYVAGKSIGGPKLLPSISPKKTWAGLGGAIGFAMAVAYVFALYLKAHDVNMGVSFETFTTKLVLSAGCLAIISQAGDFFESAIKRRLGLKDSSNIIPGHGGLFDRVDGLLFAAMAMALALFGSNMGWF